MKKAQHNKKAKYPFNNHSILKFISETQNQTDNSKTESFGLQLFNKGSRDSSTSLSVLEDVDDAEDKAISSSKKRKKCLSPNKEMKIPKVMDKLEEEIERELGSKAEKTNLSVTNVKNILKSVITNTDVLNMVRQSLNGEIESTYEPKLTRAKTKELLMMSPKKPLPPVLALTPVKTIPSSECKVLIDRDLPEDSSDEEYDPNVEEPVSDDEDKEATYSIFSDLESLPMTPASIQAPDTPNPDLIDDGVFVRPQENVGQRTRSKLSLSATPLEVIEQSFIPPDITIDMYDSVCDNDDWSDFLKEFCQPLDEVVNETVDDVEADPEYNVLADENAERVDKEELRVDRAVKVSRKELNALMDEIREYTDMMSSEEDDVINPASFMPMSPVAAVISEEINKCVEPPPVDNKTEDSIKEEEKLMKEEEKLMKEEEKLTKEEENNFTNIYLTHQQECLLSQQIRQHVQLLTQHFLQTYKHPILCNLASTFKQHLCTLYYLGEGKKCSYFRPSNLEPALKAVHDWEDLMEDPKKSLPIIKFIEEELDKANFFKKRSQLYHDGDFPEELKDLVFRSNAFLYPLLLPPLPFQPFNRKPVVRFTDSENMLIALSLEELIPYMKANKDLYKKVTMSTLAKLIVELNIPHGEYGAIAGHIKKMKEQNTNNPIKHYYDKSTAPIIQHFIVPLSPGTTLIQQSLALLPEVWKNFLLEKNMANYTNR